MNDRQLAAARGVLFAFPDLKVSVGTNAASLTPCLKSDPAALGARVDVPDGMSADALVRAFKQSCIDLMAAQNG